MRRVLLALVTTTTGLVLLLGFKTHPLTPAVAPTTVSSAGSGNASAGGSTSARGTRTVTGDTFDTPYGPVQVRITLSGGRVTDVTAVHYPSGNPRDDQINSFAVPQLNAEAVAAGNARIDTVSGATYTSEGYLQSLQSALDKAGL